MCTYSELSVQQNAHAQNISCNYTNLARTFYNTNHLLFNTTHTIMIVIVDINMKQFAVILNIANAFGVVTCQFLCLELASCVSPAP